MRNQDALSWSHSEDEAARRALGGIEVMRRGGVAERVIGTACAAQDYGSCEASTSLSRSSRVRMGEWKFCK